MWAPRLSAAHFQTAMEIFQPGTDRRSGVRLAFDLLLSLIRWWLLEAADVPLHLHGHIEDAPPDVQQQRVLLGAGRLQNVKLGAQQLCFHVVSSPGHHPLVDELVLAVQEEEKHARNGGGQSLQTWAGGGAEGFGAVEQDLSVQVLEGGAGHQSVRAREPRSEIRITHRF